MVTIAPLENPVRHYPWGSRTAIRELFGRTGPASEPEAEVWLGAHPLASSAVVLPDGGRRPLSALIDEAPEAVLGAHVARRFSGALPFLLKVLAAERPLSLQAHPDAARARAGFALETREGRALDDSRRNYRDPRHKPELLYALSDFWIVRGLRPLAEIAAAVGRLDLQPYLGAAVEAAQSRTIAAFVTAWLGLDTERAAAAVDTALTRAGSLQDDAADGWIARLADAWPGDPGALAPAFMHLTRLAPGTAIFTPPGVLHAYLGGLAIELMASSDNVLRGALTGKHKDLPELLAALDLSPGATTPPRPVTGVPAGPYARRLPTAAEEFELTVIELAAGGAFAPDRKGVEILLCTRGRAEIQNGGARESHPIGPGDAYLISGLAPYRLRGEATVFRAAVP